jgi:DNA polymerase III subunit epsilon
MKQETKIEEVPFEEAEYCVFDFETTGTSSRTDKVIEIGMAKIKKEKIVDTFTSYINPGRPVPYFITTLTGITNSDVQDAPYFEELYLKIKEFVGDSVLVAHNLSFDISFFRNECFASEQEMLRNPSICTLKLARRIFPELPSKSLGNVVKHLKIRHRDVHRGLGDATATAKILMKMFKSLREDHNIDSISDLISFQGSPSAIQPFRILKKKLINDLARIPDRPGVYFFKNAQGKIIYIGKAKSLKERVRNHFMSNAIRKSKKIVQAASSLDFQITNSELTALLAEAELIKVHNPRFNTLLKKFPRNYFVKITSDQKFPVVEIASEFNFDGHDYYGPYPNRNSATETKEIIDRTFQLRECSEKELGKKKKCYLSDIKRCLTPCLEEDISDIYMKELEKVHEFLSGQNQSAFDRLLGKMKELSEKQKFEEAAEVRDVVQRILNQLLRSSILSEPMNKANALIEVNSQPKNDYILLLAGKMFLKNFFVDTQDNFEAVLEEYFEHSIYDNYELTDKDLERIKISLSWLIKNRNGIKVHYLKNFTSVEELYANLRFVSQSVR